MKNCREIENITRCSPHIVYTGSLNDIKFVGTLYVKPSQLRREVDKLGQTSICDPKLDTKYMMFKSYLYCQKYDFN